MASGDRSRIIFLLALSGRSGTNHLHNLISHHFDIRGTDTPFWEDYLLHEAHHLKAYSKAVFGHWSDVAGDLAEPIIQTTLEAALGETLCQFLVKDIEEPFVVTKTPSIRNIDLIRHFFPNEKLIILLRDGRDVVASGMKSFGWKIEDSAMYWANCVDRLQAYCEASRTDHRLIVRFEEVISDPKGILDEIFRYIGVDPALYNWNIGALKKVIGSSELRERKGDLHWSPTEKPMGFNPIGRWQDWSDGEKALFDKLAGRQLEALQTLV